MIIILGMHRSGTSALAGTLHSGGVMMGDKFDQPVPENPKGFFEDLKIQKINMEILASIGRKWDNIPENTELNNVPEEILKLLPPAYQYFHTRFKKWGWKDPRLCITFPLWANILPLKEMHVLFILRHPISVARSLFIRNQIPIEKGIELWAGYNKNISNILEQYKLPYTFILYESLITNPEIHQKMLERHLNIRMGNAWQFIDNKLNRSELKNSDLPENIRNLYEDLILKWDNTNKFLQSLDDADLKEGENYFEKRDLEKARLHFNKVLERYPDHAEAYNNLGVIEFDKGNYDQALLFFEKSLTLGNNYFDALINKADCLKNMGNYKDARNEYNRVLKLDTDNTRILNSLGECFINLKDLKTAYKCYSVSIWLDSNQTRVKEILKKLESQGLLDSKKPDNQANTTKNITEKKESGISNNLQTNIQVNFDNYGIQKGSCNICGSQKGFLLTAPENPRESWVCQSCGSTSRDRMYIYAFSSALKNPSPLIDWIENSSISILETTGARAHPRILKSKFNYLNTKYDPEKMIDPDYDRKLYADLQSLHYNDNSFNVVMSSDVFEHIRLHKEALKEIFRVLKPGGIMLLQAPFHPENKENIIRVKPEGDKDIYLCPPVYHNENTLVYRVYGAEFISEIKSAGFIVEAIEDEIPENCITRQNIIIAQKPIESSITYQASEIELPTNLSNANTSINNVKLDSNKLLPASIIIPVFNQVEYTIRCLDALKKHTPEDIYEIIIIDNNSTDGTQEYLSHLTGKVKIIKNKENQGFTIASNQGATEAKGKYLVFLNNDTEPRAGWLESLINLAQSDPSIGAVGAKLIYPNGTIQEAGALIFSDGNGWNFGNGDDPRRELYNNICEVDYCSGACLLVRSDLFSALGGFDEQYAPAYYEETDLCFGLRKLGYKVMYNPKAEVIHHESVTAGSDINSGLKKYIQINRQKFIEKWKNELILQDDHPSIRKKNPSTVSRTRLNNIMKQPPTLNVKPSSMLNNENTQTQQSEHINLPDVTNEKKVLAFFPHNLMPPKTGAHRRCLDLLLSFRMAGYDVTLVSSTLFSDFPWTKESIDQLKSGHGITVFLHKGSQEDISYTQSHNPKTDWHYYTPPSLINFFNKTYDTLKPEIVFINYIMWGGLVADSKFDSTLLIIEMHDLVTRNDKMQKHAWQIAGQLPIDPRTISPSFIDDVFYKLIDTSPSPEEFNAYDRFDIVTAIAPDEAALVTSNTNRPEVVTLPHIFNPHCCKNSYSLSPVFLIGYNIFNFQGYVYFVNRVLPLILAEMPDFELRIIGDACKHLTPAKGIELVGYVPDLESLYKDASFAVCPLIGGTGQQIKIVEAMAYGVPVITMSNVSASSPIIHNENGFIAGNTEEFAKYMLMLLNNKDLCRKLGDATRKTIAEAYSKNNNNVILHDAIKRKFKTKQAIAKKSVSSLSQDITFNNEEQITKNNNIIFLRPDSIGDNILASSMLPYIHEHFKGANITVLCQEHIAELYRSNPYVSNIMTFNRMKAIKDEICRNDLIRSLRELNADILLNSVYSREPITDFIALNSGAKKTVVLEGDLSNMSEEIRQKNNSFYSVLIKSDGDHKCEIERSRDFLKGIHIKAEKLEPDIWISPEDNGFAEDFFNKNNLDPDKTICLFAGAQYDVRIYDDYGTSLADICREQGFSVIGLGNAEDSEINEINLSSIDALTINMSGKTNLSQTAAILSHCRLAVGAETGLAHMACAVGIPNVILLGGGHFGRFMPYSPLTSIVCLPLDCYYCNWKCKYSRTHCVKDIKPEVMAKAIQQTLEKSSENPRVFVQGSSLWKHDQGYPMWQSFHNYLHLAEVDVHTVGKIDPFVSKIWEELNTKDKKAQRIYINTIVDELIKHGEGLFSENDLEGAETSFLRALELQNNSPEDLEKLEAPKANTECKINASDFSHFTYSKNSHFLCFDDYDLKLYGKKINPQDSDLKVYQDLLVYAFIHQNIPKGSKILEIGGGDSRVLTAINNDYECWNIDKMEGLGNGPTVENNYKYRLIKDYIGNFSEELKDNYFDFVFSISALEHTEEKEETFLNICRDIDRVLKPDGFSLHTLDIDIKNDKIWSNRLLGYMFKKYPSCNSFISFDNVINDPDLYTMSEPAYSRLWQPVTGKSYADFGKPASYNILWQKPSVLRTDKHQKKYTALQSVTNSKNLMKQLKKNSKFINSLPKISIVTPSYNQGEFLDECINSILGQNYPNLEYIIMDGGSTDGSVEIIKKYEKRLAYWQSKPDGGQYHAINEGFKRSSGEIMGWLNSDDRLHEDSLYIMACIFKSNINVNWIMGRPTVWDGNGNLTNILDPIPRWSRNDYLSRQYGPPHIQQESTFWRKPLWEKAGSHIDTSLDYAGDLELWSRFFRFDDLYSVDALLGGFRSHSKQKTSTRMVDYDREANEILDREIDLFNKNKVPLRQSPPVIFFDYPETRSITPPVTTGENYNTVEDADFIIREAKQLIKSGATDSAKELYLTYLIRHPLDEKVITAWEGLKDREEDKTILEMIPSEKRNYLVSAIVSTYKSEEFIKECIENLLSQSISSEIEIVIVDAASPQAEGKVVKRYQEKYPNITYIRTISRIGVYTAWNIAIKAANGKFCISVSTNDNLSNNSCEILARTLRDNPDIMMVYGNTYLTHTAHETFEKNNHYGKYEWLEYSFEHLMRECLVGPHPMWRRSVHEEIGYFDEKFVADGDQEFWLRIGERFKCLHINEFTGLQWITSNALSRKGNIPTLENHFVHSYYQSRFRKNFIKSNVKCSIIIPVFNKIEFTKQCIEALIENTPDELYEVIIVDNASTDGTNDFLNTLEGGVTIIKNNTNMGFAHACNQGAEAAQGEYLMFLNNDTQPQKGWLVSLVKILDSDSTVAATGSKLIFPDGTIQHAGVAIIDDKKLPDPLVARHIYYHEPSDHPEANQSRTYQALTAACILIRKEVYQKVGGFDIGYWNGYEDVDFCFKLQEKGWKLVYHPKSVVVHHESVSGPERFKQVKHNIDRLHKRWIGKIKPDVIINEDGSNTIGDANRIHPYIVADEPKPEINSNYFNVQNSLTSIIILTFNQIKYTKECIKSITQYTTVPYELIIVDNGSTDGTRDFLHAYDKDHPECKLIFNKKNLGFAAGNNQGLAKTRGDYILLLNNDVIVTKHWLERLILHIESHENIGMVGPVSNFVSGPQLVENTGYENKIDKMHEFARNHSQRNTGKQQDVMRLAGFCLLIKRQVFYIIGGLDEDYGSGNFEDDDLCLRSAFTGYRNVIAHDVFVHHYGNMTFKGNSIDYMASMESNRLYFTNKWKGIVEFTGDKYSVHITKEQRLNMLLGWGEEQFSKGNFRTAVKIFERILKLDPMNSQALNNLGVMQWQFGNAPSAIKIFQQALTVNPKDSNAIKNLFQAVEGSGRSDLLNKTILDTIKQANPENLNISA